LWTYWAVKSCRNLAAMEEFDIPEAGVGVVLAAPADGGAEVVSVLHKPGVHLLTFPFIQLL
jgi:hypothetical protein